jgi:hypothetical protein
MRYARLSLLTLLVCGATSTAFAQTATQTVNYDVQAISVLAMSGAPSLSVNTAVAGSANATVATGAGTFAITNNQTARKITASISVAMPAGMTLTAALPIVGGGASAGAQALTTVAVDLLTAIGPVSVSAQAVNYSLTVSSTTAPVSGSRIVTYTIM